MHPSIRTCLLTVAAFAGSTTASVAQCAVVADLLPGPTGSSPVRFTAAFGQELYFSYNDATVGVELWKWDETNGVSLVADIQTGASHSSPQQMTPACVAIGPRVFFSASKSGFGRELWMTDGTPAGTVMVKDIRTGNSSSTPGSFVACGDRVFFAANDGTNGVELWVTDGTNAGTTMVSDIFPGSTGGLPADLLALDDRVVFSALAPFIGRELWSSDGTAAGTFRIGGLASTSCTTGHVRFKDAVYYCASEPGTGLELWKTDGTIAGTALAVDILPGAGSAGPTQLTPCGDLLFFTANIGVTQPFVTDGTFAGTTALSSNPGFPIQGVLNMTSSGNRLFFSAADSSGLGAELWTSDGTAAGTTMIKDINPGLASSGPNEIVSIGANVCFSAMSNNDVELWFSDGTDAGTFRVCDIDPAGSSWPRSLTVCRGRLFFSADDPATGYELMQIQTPGADVEILGAGGLPDRPTLVTRDGAAPVFGSTIDLLAEGPAGYIGVLFYGPSALPHAPFPGLMQGGCNWVGLFFGTALQVTSTAQTSWVQPVPIPDIPAWDGLAFHFQMVWVTTGPAPILQMSNGLQLVLGPGAPH